MERVPTPAYYATYHGHETRFLATLLESLKGQHSGVVYLAGDSSLDNKFWVTDKHEAVNGYETVLDPPRMKADICFWLNHLLSQRPGPGGGPPLLALNTAVEATTLAQRTSSWFAKLLEQDIFIRDHITENDYLIVSVGANDVALSPSCATVLSALSLVYFASDRAMEEGTAWGYGHFLSLFHDQVKQYLEALISKRKPRKVLVCMIYYPDQARTGGWADMSLAALRYNKNPRLLQRMISMVFEHAVSKIRLEGTEVVPVPLFSVMDGTETGDYVERVEPSATGGRKMAELFVRHLLAPPRQAAA